MTGRERTEMTNDETRREIDEMVQLYQQKILECPHCAALKKEITNLLMMRPMDPFFLPKASIDPEILKMLDLKSRDL